VLANISKNTKILFLEGIHLLFTVNVWIKKSQMDEYPKYYWE
jgi:pantothenate kinase